MNSEELHELDDKIRLRGQTLARVLIKRISHQVKAAFPEARTIHLWFDEHAHRYNVVRVAGERSKIIVHDESGDKVQSELNDSTRLHRDVNLYVELAGARLRMISDKHHVGRPDYSIALDRD